MEPLNSLICKTIITPYGKCKVEMVGIPGCGTKVAAKLWHITAAVGQDRS